MLAFAISPAIVPVLIAAASVHPEVRAAWILALGISAFTYSTTLIAGFPAYLLFRARNWVKWWQYLVGGLLLGLLPAMLISYPHPLRGLMHFGAQDAVIGAVSGLAFWLIAFAGGPGSERGAA